ncbi:MAG: C40 family peptidase [Oscillospiraceae bacterium]|nr:C40 family peptidase [Oscillospiraceae bacterium]
MRNLKHTIIAIAAIVMVGTLSFFQVSDMSAKKSERDAKISSASQVHSMTITSTEDESGSIAVALPSTEEELESTEESDDPIDAETEQAIAEKSYLTLGYANVTGSTQLRSNPSDEAEVIGTINGADQVEVLESTDGWYKIMDNGQAGYVESSYVTLDKAEAQDSAMQYDHYKKASVSATSGLTVRASGSQDAASVGLVNDGDNIIIVGTEGEYTKIIYGNDYTEGYVINSGIETTGEWIEKQTVTEEQKRVAAEKLEAERQERIAKANAAKASSRYSITDTSASASAPAAVSSGKGGGQGIVNTAMKYLGTPYVWGGTSPAGFDCSGLVQYACRANGISVPRVAASQRGAGRYVSRENLQPGDLVFFSNGGGVSHVGIYVGNGNMIHAPQTGDVVKISSINTSYRLSHYAGAVRVW